MHQIGKKLGLLPIDMVRLIEADERIRKKGVLDIEGFRELLLFCRGLTTQLMSVTKIQPYDMIRIKLDMETYDEIMSEYKERLGIPLW